MSDESLRSAAAARAAVESTLLTDEEEERLRVAIARTACSTFSGVSATASSIKEMGDAIETTLSVDESESGACSSSKVPEPMHTDDENVDDTKAMNYMRGMFNLPPNMPNHVVWDVVHKIVMDDIEKMESNSAETEKLARQIRNYIWNRRVKRQKMDLSSGKPDPLDVLHEALQIDELNDEAQKKLLAALNDIIDVIRKEDHTVNPIPFDDDLLIGARPLAKLMMKYHKDGAYEFVDKFMKQ